MPNPVLPFPMMQYQVPDPHAVVTDINNKPTGSVFAPPASQSPVLTSLTPNTAVHGALTTVVCKGTGFTPQSVVITGNYGAESSARYVDPTTMTFVPWSGSAAGPITVNVRNVNGALSAPQTLTLT